MKTLQILGITLLLLTAAGSVQATPGVMEILANMDEIENLDDDITVKFDITETRPDQGTKVMEGVYYRRDADDAYLIVMTSPDAQKGNGYLRVGDNMWMYRRNTRTFQIMARGQSIEGSGVSSSDVETRKYANLYEPELDENGREIVSEETLGKAKIPVYRLEVKAKVKDVDYPKKIYWVRRDNFLKLKEEAYSISGTLMTTTYIPEYTEIKGRYVLARLLTIDQFEKGNKSLMELSGISLKPIDEAVFTKAYLESLSK